MLRCLNDLFAYCRENKTPKQLATLKRLYHTDTAIGPGFHAGNTCKRDHTTCGFYLTHKELPCT